MRRLILLAVVLALALAPCAARADVVMDYILGEYKKLSNNENELSCRYDDKYDTVYINIRSLNDEYSAWVRSLDDIAVSSRVAVLMVKLGDNMADMLQTTQHPGAKVSVCYMGKDYLPFALYDGSMISWSLDY